MLLATALFITGCAQRFTVQNKYTTAVAPKAHHPSFSSFLELGRENCHLTKICGGAENVVKTETQQTFVNGLLGFLYFSIYTPLEARVYYAIIA